MSKWDIRDFPQGKQPLSADLSDTPASRDRGKTLSDSKTSREILADRLTRENLVSLARAIDEVREVRPGRTQEHVKFSNFANNDIDTLNESTSKIELAPNNADTRGVNRKNHARKHTMIDCRSILAPPNGKEHPQQAKENAAQVQSSSHLKSNSGWPDKNEKFAFPSKQFKS